MLGSRISTIACPLLALYLTRSPVDAGFVAFAATAPSVLVYIPAGALVDRWDPRRTMIVCESGRGAAIAVIAFTLVLGKPDISLLVAAVVVEETLEVFSTLADQRCVRDLVPRDRTSSAQANIETRTHVVVLAGRPLGVFLFGLAPILPFVADALSFLVSVGAIVSLKIRRGTITRGGIARESGVTKRLGNDMGVGLRWLIRDKYARVALTLSSGSTLIGQALIMVFLAGARSSGLPSFWIGMVLAASGIGGVLGSMSLPWLPTPPKASLVLVQMFAWFGALLYLAVWGWHSFIAMAIVMAILSVAGALGNIEIGTYLVQFVDKSMLARATSVGRLISLSAAAVGPMLGGILLQLNGTQNAVFALVAIAAVLVVLAFFSPSMRESGAAILAASTDQAGAQRAMAARRRLGIAALALIKVLALAPAEFMTPSGALFAALTAHRPSVRPQTTTQISNLPAHLASGSPETGRAGPVGDDVLLLTLLSPDAKSVTVSRGPVYTTGGRAARPANADERKLEALLGDGSQLHELDYSHARKLTIVEISPSTSKVFTTLVHPRGQTFNVAPADPRAIAVEDYDVCLLPTTQAEYRTGDGHAREPEYAQTA